MMGIFDFFRQRKEVPDKEEVNFGDLQSWILRKIKEEEEKEKRTIEKIKSLIIEFTQRLDKQIEVLNRVDVTNKREELRLKDITMKNKEEYQNRLSGLINDLKLINQNKLEEFVKHLNRIFAEFKRESRIYYERATILIGREIGDIKETLARFLTELNNLLEKNKDIFSDSKTISNIESQLKEIPEIDKEIKLAETKLNERRNRKIELEKEIVKFEKEIKEKQKSKEYLEEKNLKEKVVSEKKKVAEEISFLKSKIDFKSLKNKYHTNDKKMEIIKEYEANFSIILDKEDIFCFLSDEEVALLKEKREKIKKEIKEIESIESKGDSFVLLTSEKISIVSALKNSEQEIKITEQEIERLKNTLELTKQEISKSADLLNVKVLF